MLPGLVCNPSLIRAHGKRRHPQKHSEYDSHKRSHHHVSSTALSLYLLFEPTARSRISELCVQIRQSVGQVDVRDVLFANPSYGTKLEVEYVWVK